jgi:hypothetical protein
LRDQYQANAQALEQSQRIVAEQQQQVDGAAITDNRARLNSFYENQRTSRAKNVVTDLKGKFEAVNGAMPSAGGVGEGFKHEWLLKNKLDSATKPDEGKLGGRVQDLQFGQKAAKPTPANQPTSSAASQPQAAGVAQGQVKQQLEREAGEKRPGDSKEIAPDDSRSQLRRYQQRLEANAPAGGAGIGGMVVDGGFGGDRDGVEMQVFGKDAAGGIPVGGPASGTLPASGASVPSSLASLEVALPPLGAGYHEVLFTTPRGEVEITARPVSEETRHRATRLAAVLAVVLVVWLAVRGARHYGRQLIASRLAALVLILAGLANLFTWLLPLVGLAALLSGIALLTWQLLARHRLLSK